MGTVKLPLCGRCEDGWLVDDVTGDILSRCACRTTPTAGRDKGMLAAVEANPNALNAAVRIITDTAHRLEVFSANDMRVELDAAQIPGPVVGAAFAQAARRGLIRRDGYVPSTLGNTHGHEVKRWRSLIWRPGATA